MVLRVLSVGLVMGVMPFSHQASEWIQEMDFSPHKSCASLYESSEMRALALDLSHIPSNHRPGFPEPLPQKMIRLDHMKGRLIMPPHDKDGALHVPDVPEGKGDLMAHPEPNLQTTAVTESELWDVSLVENPQPF